MLYLYVYLLYFVLQPSTEDNENYTAHLPISGLLFIALIITCAHNMKLRKVSLPYIYSLATHFIMASFDNKSWLRESISLELNRES